MAATSSPSPLELYQSHGIERLDGSSSAGLLFRRSPNASQLTAATVSSASLPCSPANSPSSSSSTHGDLRQSAVPPSTASFQAAAAAFALSLALGGRHAASRQPVASAFGPPPLPSSHQLIFNGGRHGGLPSPTGMNCSAAAAGSQHLPRHQPLEASAFYVPPHLMQNDVTPPTESWNNLYNSSATTLRNLPTAYDPRVAAEFQPYLHCYGGLQDVRRKNATRESTSTLKSWLVQHIKNPYPTKGEKIMLAIITKMTLTQVSTWFANARRRLKKENKMQWSPRQRSGDDDDDDVIEDDDDIHNDVINGSFSMSDDEGTDDVVVQTDYNDARSTTPPRNYRINTAYDRASDQMTSAEIDYSMATGRQPAISDESDRSPVGYHRKLSPHRPSLISQRSENNSDNVDVITASRDKNAVSSSGSKSRIWSIVELATSGDEGSSRRNNPSAVSLGSGSCRKTAPSPCNEALDHRPNRVDPDSVNTTVMQQRQLADEAAIFSMAASVNSHFRFPVGPTTFEALHRCQMAMAAYRAAAAAAASDGCRSDIGCGSDSVGRVDSPPCVDS